MTNISPARRSPRRASTAALGLLVGALALAAPAGAAEVDLLGSWYVLIHFRDTATANPDSDRWDDRIWTFSKKGSRLQWTEYPIVVFSDQSGRFGSVGRNPRSRIMHAWEPNKGQQAEIDAGLQVNSRGAKTKALRGSPKRGYKSVGSAGRSMSALTVSYQETWTIDSPTTLPVFTRDDVMGTEASMATGSSGNVEGRTQYKAASVSDDGSVIRGAFARDESRSGVFRMTRMGDPRAIESDGRSPNEKAADRAREQFMEAARGGGREEFYRAIEAEAPPDLRQRVGDEKLDAIWAEYSDRLIAQEATAVAAARKDIGDAYAEALTEDLTERLAATDGNLLAALQDGGASEADAELARQVQEVLGEEGVADLRERYSERILAGDGAAKAELRKEIEQRYEAAVRADFARRIDDGDAEAVREMREAMRREQERRP